MKCFWRSHAVCERCWVMRVKMSRKFQIKAVCSIPGEIYLVYIGDINDPVRYSHTCWFFNFTSTTISHYNRGRCSAMTCATKSNVKSASVLLGQVRCPNDIEVGSFPSIPRVKCQQAILYSYKCDFGTNLHCFHLDREWSC